MASLDSSQCPAVESVPGKVGGAWVFKGTRTPVAIVFDNLEDGMTIDEVVEQFAYVHPKAHFMLREFLLHARNRLKKTREEDWLPTHGDLKYDQLLHGDGMRAVDPGLLMRQHRLTLALAMVVLSVDGRFRRVSRLRKSFITGSTLSGLWRLPVA